MTLLQDEIYLMFPLGLLTFFTFYFFKKFGFFQIQAKARPNLSFKIAASAFALFFLVQLIVVPAFVHLYFAIKKRGFPEEIHLSAFDQIWFNVFSSLVITATFLVYSSFLKKDNNEAIFGIRSAVFAPFFVGLLSWFFAYPLVSFLGQSLQTGIQFFFNTPLNEQVAVIFVKKSLESPPLFASVVLMVTGFVPFIEEFLFRGCLQTWLVGIWGRKKAILTTSIIFSLFHYSSSQGVNNIEILFSLFILSLILGYVYEREESLLASIGLHSTFNAMTILFLLASN
jgi:membrane protease YdiL (CAAX protease family)